jgi:site-specific DNA-cytosine methylase
MAVNNYQNHNFYEFLGSVVRQFTQVGNTVPLILATQIGTAICKIFSNNLFNALRRPWRS